MASGNYLFSWSAASGIPPSTTFATLARRNNHLVANFDADADESLDFEGVLPAHYAGGGVRVLLAWMAATATAGDVIWNTQIERHEDDAVDLDSDSFATAQAATSTAASATGEVQYVTIDHSSGANMDSLAVGESFRLRVTRDANNGSDNMAGDAQLMRVALIEI